MAKDFKPAGRLNLSPQDKEFLNSLVGDDNTMLKCNAYSVNNYEFSSKHISKRHIFSVLKKCNYRTSRRKIAVLLAAYFEDYPAKPGHWFYIARNYYPRAILRTFHQMEKRRRAGITIRNPAAFFTFLIKLRRKRRSSTRINAIELTTQKGGDEHEH